jgi:predicted HD phosphohydrolase
MEDGTRADYELLGHYEDQYTAQLPQRLVKALEALKNSLVGYQVTRYEHSLQSGSRALRAGEDDEYVAAALLHDIGDELAPYTHGEMVAAVLQPYVAPRICWIISHHGIFQSYYYAHHTGGDRYARERYRDHVWFQDCLDFCAKYDQNCFDPNYDSEPLDSFVPIVEGVFSEARYLDRER